MITDPTEELCNLPYYRVGYNILLIEEFTSHLASHMVSTLKLAVMHCEKMVRVACSD